MDKYLKKLKRVNAPEELIASFVEVCKINSEFEGELRATVKELLIEQCRRFGFEDLLPDDYFFRPYRTGTDSNNYQHDTAVLASEPRASAIEQAYRRGYCHGFHEALSSDESKVRLEKRMKELMNWRCREIQQFGSRPGSNEKLPTDPFAIGRSISLRLRHEVFVRDNCKCCICGRSSKDDNVKLEVDHIVPVSKGGNNEIDNLQTLCFDCNRGKADS